MQPNPPSPQAATTNTLDIPPALASLLNMGNIQTPTMPNPPMPAYAMGGQVGPGGQPMPPSQPGLAQAGAQRNMSPQQIQAEAQRFAQQHPQQVQQIQLGVQQALQSGELTMQELNTMVQMATVAIQNPEMYPQRSEEHTSELQSH